MSIKYQIFVSSTYEDLKEEREQVVRAILEMGHIPVGMEMFSAADETQWKIIARTIDNCDYYVVIIAHRYGSLDGKRSFTEKEYDYAIKIGVPTLGFIIDKAAAWPVDRIDTEDSKKSALEAFRERLKKKLVTFWKSSEDLYGKVPIALMKQMTANPRPGWVRASVAVSPEVTNELSRLSKENAELRNQLKLALAASPTSQPPNEWATFFDLCLDLIGPLKRNQDSVRNGFRDVGLETQVTQRIADIQKCIGRMTMQPDADTKWIDMARDLFTGILNQEAKVNEIEKFRQLTVEHFREGAGQRKKTSKSR